MKKILLIVLVSSLAVLVYPLKTHAAGGIYASGGGNKTIGQTFTVSVVASGGTFNALEGTISVSGPVSIVSFSPGTATWTSAPADGSHFVGIVLPETSSLTVATIKLKGTSAGSGVVSVSSVRLANAGTEIGSDSGNTSFTIQKASNQSAAPKASPDLPAAPTVTSPTHPDQSQSYEATAITLNWNKDSGVDGFSYVLDHENGTTPEAKTVDTATSASYADQAVGTYFFHIRAHKRDGWGATTTFKINIKAASPKIDSTLTKPGGIKIEKTPTFVNDITNGTVTGVKISGKTLANYSASVVLTPAITVPPGKKLSSVADNNGNFSILLDWSIPAGHYVLTAQSQKDLTLTPSSDPIIFEISQASGGEINILTPTDSQPSNKSAAEKKFNWQLISEIAGVVLIALLLGFLIYWWLRKRQLAKSDMINFS